MIRDFIDDLKRKRQRLVEFGSSKDFYEDEKQGVDIIIDKHKNFFRMQISDYVNICEYSNKTDKEDIYGMSKKISMSVLWNSGKQKINKGTFFVFVDGDAIYNFWVNGNEIRIDERIKLEEESQERILRFNLDTNEYGFTFFKHDIFGSTFYTKYYHSKGIDMGKLAFSKKEFADEVKLFLERISSVENVFEIIKLRLISERLFNDLGPDGVIKRYANNE